MTEETSSARAKKIDDILDKLLDMEPSERAAALADLCQGDAGLMADIVDLLEAVNSSDDFFSKVDQVRDQIIGEAFVAADSRDALTSAVRPGETVGAYELEKIIGEGSKAIVYKGCRREEDWQQTVALKFMKRGVDTDDVYRRFMAERQILTLLNHPHIASLIDGGTTEEGLPFFVMEYVDGVALDDFCTQEKLGLRQKLEIFLDAVSAIEFAHRNLIVHRDIKPSNILVDKQGHLKLLDFGIAKVLDPLPGTVQTPITVTQVRPLTPAYASPEQLSGTPITTATDIYQLGLLLYKLVTGDLPFASNENDQTTTNETLALAPSRVLNEGDRHLKRQLRGDMDTIILKALMPEPEERYLTARALGNDIRRYLAKEPILARPATTGYKTRKFLSRNPWVAPVAALLFIGLVTYVTTLTIFADRVANERDRAEEIKTLVVDLFSAADPLSGVVVGKGRDLTMVEFLGVAAQRTRNELGTRSDLRAELLGVLSNAYSELGMTQEALSLRQETIRLEETLYGANSKAAIASMRALGGLKLQMDDWQEGLVLYQKALAITEAGGKSFDLEEGKTLFALAKLSLDRVSISEGIEYLERAAKVLRTVKDAPPDLLESVLMRTIQVVEEPDRLPEMERLGREVLARREARFGTDSGAVAIAMAEITLAASVRLLGKFDESRMLYEKAIPVLERQYGEDHPIVTSVLNNLAVLFITDLPDYERARDIQKKIITIETKRWGEDHAEVGMRWQNLAATLYRMKDFEGTKHAAGRAKEIFARTVEPGMYLHAMPDLTLSAVFLDQEDHTAAEGAARRALDILEGAFPETSLARLMAQCRLGRALAGQGRRDEGRQLMAGAISILETLGPVGLVSLTECRSAFDAA